MLLRMANLVYNPRLAVVALLLSLCSCDSQLFGFDSRDIGGGYRLKRSGIPSHFALITPHENGGLIIDEIGWNAPVIVARGAGSSYWDAIDTAHAQHTRISDAAKKIGSTLSVGQRANGGAGLEQSERTETSLVTAPLDFHGPA